MSGFQPRGGFHQFRDSLPHHGEYRDDRADYHQGRHYPNNPATFQGFEEFEEDWQRAARHGHGRGRNNNHRWKKHHYRGNHPGRRGRGRHAFGFSNRETPEGSNSQENTGGDIGAADGLPPARFGDPTDDNTSDDESPIWLHEYGPQYDTPAEHIDSASHQSKHHVDSVEEIISSTLVLMGLERSPRIIITANCPEESTCLVPTPLIALTRSIRRKICTLDNLNDDYSHGQDSQAIISLEPTVNGVPMDGDTPTFPTVTLAEDFIKHPMKAWLSTGVPQLKAEVFYSQKLLIWARALLVSKHDNSFLGRAGILRGVLGSLYEVPIKWPLIQAFLTFWNSEGHTLVTSQGEMGFPLLALQDAMGIPISGRVYDEYIPDSCFKDDVAAALFSSYASIRKSKIEKGQSEDGPVTLNEWIDYFLYDATQVENSHRIPLPSSFYADIDDPLLERLNFRMTHHSSKAMPLGVYFSDQVMQFNAHYSRTHLRAAFVAAWLCSYCVPVGMGAIIRPEVFMAAASIAKGVRRAIGIASMAYLYESLDAIQSSIRRGTRSSNKCRLSLPTHFIMGWFACYWRAMPAEPTIITTITKFPPFISEIWRASEMEINLEDAHRLFLDVDVQHHCLMHLDFLGRSRIRFPENEPNHIVDQRHAPDNKRQLKISEVDLLVSSSVGGVSHRRCQIHNNQVYCPQRFARMFNCDQAVPDMFMDGLLRADHFEGTMDETTELLRRRLLAYWLPNGHTFMAQVRERIPVCSSGYGLWCKTYVGFLKDANIFCAGVTPTSEEKDKIVVQPVPPIVSEPPGDMGTVAPSPLQEATTEEATPIKVSAIEKPELSIPAKGRRERQGVAKRSVKSMAGTHTEAPVTDFIDCDTEIAAMVKGTVDEDLTSTAHDGEDKSWSESKARELKPNTSKRKKSDASEDTEGSKPKKTRPSKAKINNWSATTGQAIIERVSSYIKPRVEAFEKTAKDDFNMSFPSLDPAPDNYDGVSGVVLRASDITDESQRDLFLYAKQDLQILQNLASAAELDKSAFTDMINKVLARWGKLFSTQISEGMEKMVEALQALKELLSCDATPPSIDIEGMAAHRRRIKKTLKEAAAIQEVILLIFTELGGIEDIANLKREALATSRVQQEKKIADLKASLALAEEKFQETQNQEAEIENFFKESEAARQDFDNMSIKVKENADHGELALVEADQCMQYIGVDEGSSQPKPMRSLLAFMQASSCEE